MPIISREVRGLPDDVSAVNINARGWLVTGTAGRVNAFLQPNGSISTALAALNPTTNGQSQIFDSEPDIFSYSLPGHSGKFVIDVQLGTPVCRTIPYDPIDITINYTAGQIAKFTVATPEGVTCLFNVKDMMKKSMSNLYQNPTTGNIPGTYEIPSAPHFFKREYDYLKPIDTSLDSYISYATAWRASTVTTQDEQIVLSYSAEIAVPQVK